MFTGMPRKDYFDIYGNLTYQMDERGFITRTSFDIPTEGLIPKGGKAGTATAELICNGWHCVGESKPDVSNRRQCLWGLWTEVQLKCEKGLLYQGGPYWGTNKPSSRRQAPEWHVE
jgi:hypothetical protein